MQCLIQFTTNKININSSDWKSQTETIYYSHKRRAWHCIECRYLTKSPRGVHFHAAKHGIQLPSARKEYEITQTSESDYVNREEESDECILIPGITGAQEYTKKQEIDFPSHETIKERLWRELMDEGEYNKKIEESGIFPKEEMDWYKDTFLMLKQAQYGFKTRRELINFLIR